MSTTAVDAAEFVDICLCARCYAGLEEAGYDQVRCTTCGAHYPISNGVLRLLAPESDELHDRFRENYDQIAEADLEKPFEDNRNARHATLIDFIGDVSGQRVLDLGSSDGGYLRLLEGAAQRVAVDLAAPFLEAIPDDAGILRVCADAEVLPFKPGSFDVVVISDVLEHLLAPDRLVAQLSKLVNPNTRVIVHVPWEEDITAYRDSEWEFTHLRTFTYYTFASLWSNFKIVRERSSYPALEEPFVFAMRRYLPLSVYNFLSWAYFHGGYAQSEYKRRARWIQELPARERWLVRLYRPLFKIFELRILERRLTTRGGYAAPAFGPLLRVIRSVFTT